MYNLKVFGEKLGSVLSAVVSTDVPIFMLLRSDSNQGCAASRDRRGSHDAFTLNCLPRDCTRRTALRESVNHTCTCPKATGVHSVCRRDCFNKGSNSTRREISSKPLSISTRYVPKSYLRTFKFHLIVRQYSLSRVTIPQTICFWIHAPLPTLGWDWLKKP